MSLKVTKINFILINFVNFILKHPWNQDFLQMMNQADLLLSKKKKNPPKVTKKIVIRFVLIKFSIALNIEDFYITTAPSNRRVFRNPRERQRNTYRSRLGEDDPVGVIHPDYVSIVDIELRNLELRDNRQMLEREQRVLDQRIIDIRERINQNRAMEAFRNFAGFEEYVPNREMREEELIPADRFSNVKQFWEGLEGRRSPKE